MTAWYQGGGMAVRRMRMSGRFANPTKAFALVVYISQVEAVVWTSRLCERQLRQEIQG